MKLLKFILLLIAFKTVSSELVKKRSNRVIGGSRAALGDLPYFAHIETSDVQQNYATCGGSFIRYNFVLTAAHCVTAKINAGVYGGYVIFAGFYEFHEVIIPANLIPHESWSTVNVHLHNIGLIRLLTSSPSIFNGNYIRQIALPTPADANNSFEGFSLRAMGFGNGQFLYHGDMRVILNSQCSQTIPSIGSGNVCGSPDYGVVPCLGDDGGPGTVSRSGERIVLGVFSVGSYACNTNEPAVYTRVTSYLSWIESYINDVPIHTTGTSTWELTTSTAPI